ncbi:MAG: ABC transporter substrate-binding protein, partial [Clostridia bacterium]|nr:ABC transporter substrate-binding protein [Clostridia bacterium]
VRLGGMTGPTTMGLVGVLDADEKGESLNDYEFTLAGSADVLTPMLVNGELDIACVPANLASVLYNNTNGAVKLLNINTLGVLYIVESGDSVKSIEDLKGRTLLATGRGSTPEYSLRYVLEQNAIADEVTIEWKSEPAEVVATMQAQDGYVAMLPQPYVTIAMGQVEGLRVAIDLTAEWEKIDGAGQLITGVTVVRTAYLEEHEEAVRQFLSDYEKSVSFVNSDNEAAAELIEHFGVFKAAVAQKALPQCNITFISGEEAKALVNDYLSVLFEQNPKAVGEQIPDDGFYYIAQ